MRIGIDVSSVIYETGVSYYTRNLVSALLEIDKDNEYVLFGGTLRRSNDLNQWSKTLKGNFTSKFTKFPPSVLNLLWNKLHILPVETFTGKLDVFHSSDWAQPPTGSYNITTVHDLVPVRFPEISHPSIVSAHKSRLKWVKKEVDRIIAVSKFTKRELVELFDINPDKIKVIYEAAHPNLKKASFEKEEKIKMKHGIKGAYLLVVGADPRKNVPVIIQAFSRVRKSNPDLKLVITGRLWSELPYTSGVSSLGHVPKDDLNVLYSGAEALVYTSLYEGFGLPILEAMQVGTPVVTSNVSSMPEIAGDAAVLVNPKEAPEIAEGIKEVLKNKDKWSNRGIIRAKDFSWKRTAKQTLNVYKSGI